MNQAIFEKIEKLLALASSANIHESTLASAKVQEILIRYNLSLAGIPARGGEKYISKQIMIPKECQDATYGTLLILGKFFFVQPILTKVLLPSQPIPKTDNAFVLLGTPTNVQVAEYIYFFLARRFSALWLIQSLEVSASEKENYLRGLAFGVSEGLKENEIKIEVAKSMDLMILKKDSGLQAFVQEKFPHLSYPSTKGYNRDSEFFSQGQTDGRSIRLRKGVSSTSESNGKRIN